MTQAQMEDRETNRRISKAIQLDIEKRKIMNQLPMCCVHPLHIYQPR